MAIVLQIDNPNGSKELYERLKERLGLERPAGGILHVAGASPNGGWRVVEVFESKEQATQFMEDRLRPAFQELGAPPPPPPEFWPADSYMV